MATRIDPTEGTGGGADRRLRVVMYHYVRDLVRTRFPRIKGLPIDVFRRQVAMFASDCELATMETAMAFLDGRYAPRRDLCLLTFDDGLREHYAEVMPILQEYGAGGVFFPPTACLDGDVAAVHQIHFLMAATPLADLERDLDDACAARGIVLEAIDAAELRRCYPWDDDGTARFKFVLNFQLPPEVREAIVAALFAARLGDASAFARELYVTWDELREMQRAGMVIGGHSHAHRALTTLGRDAMAEDVARCAALLHRRLDPQPHWPFAYPYGWYDATAKAVVAASGFDAAFTVRSGANAPGQDRFELHRFDTVELLPA